jgi:hypothetical protein
MTDCSSCVLFLDEKFITANKHEEQANTKTITFWQVAEHQHAKKSAKRILLNMLCQ